MKKIMVLATAIITAVVANASTVKWSATGIAQDPDGTAYNGYTLYLCDASVYSAATLAADLAAGTTDKLSEAGFVQATSGTVQQGTAEYAKIASTYSGGNYTAGQSYTFYTLVLNDSDPSGASYFTISADVTKTAPGTGYLQMTFSNLSNGAQNGWTPVPEPTSGLLLLLGVAGLALKRKRA